MTGVPVVLQDRLSEALDGHAPDGEPADVYRQVARRLLGELRGDESRADALTLLAADAFMTYACEATGENHPERLGDLT